MSGDPQPAMRYDDRIAGTMFTLLRSRAEGATICPSEVARALEPVDWRRLMPRVREVAVTLAAAGEVEVRQRGRVIEPFSEIRGPLRIARCARADVVRASLPVPQPDAGDQLPVRTAPTSDVVSDDRWLR